MEIQPKNSFGKQSKFNDIRYLTGGVYPQNKCSICEIKRIDKFGKPKWKSDLLIKHYFIPNHIRVITICPKCRELPLNTIFKKIIEKDAHTITKNDKKNKKRNH